MHSAEGLKCMHSAFRSGRSARTAGQSCAHSSEGVDDCDVIRRFCRRLVRHDHRGRWPRSLSVVILQVSVVHHPRARQHIPSRCILICKPCVTTVIDIRGTLFALRSKSKRFRSLKGPPARGSMHTLGVDAEVLSKSRSRPGPVPTAHL